MWSEAPADLTTRVSKRVRDRVRLVGPPDGPEEAFIAGADVLCLASGGVRVAPGLIGKAFAAGAVPVVSDLELYRELAEDGEAGLLFPPGDFQTLRAQVARVLSEAKLREGLRQSRRRQRRGEELVRGRRSGRGGVYERVAARRHDPEGDRAVRSRLGDREFIHCDLHMHTDHSPDCATPVETLIETAKERGLGAIAITDHNEVSGALAARDVAERVGGIKVIVAEEVKTAEQGEVIGLFLEEKIERGMTMAETIAEIRRQGGLVYVPHPFDRLHSVPDYEHLLEHRRGDRHPRGLQPAGRAHGLQRGGRALRPQVPDRPRRRLRQPRRPGARQRPGPDPRLRRAGRVPRGDARRRHRPQAQEPRLRPGPEVPPDQRRPGRQAPKPNWRAGKS